MSGEPVGMSSSMAAGQMLAVNDGVVRRAELVRAGVSRGWLARRLADGSLFELFPGVIADTATPRHRLLAAQVFAGSGSRLSHTTAAQWYGLRRPDGEDRVHVSVPHGRNRASVPGLVLHQARSGGHVADGPLRLVPLPQTLFDLTDLLGLDEARFLATEARRRGLVTPEDLRSDVRPSRRLAGAWAAVLEEMDAGALSGGEAKYWRALKDANVPLPRLNARIRLARSTYVVDALWRSHGLAAEIDGRTVHAHAAAFEADRARQNELHVAGLMVIRFPVSLVMRDPAAVAEQTREALIARAHELRVPGGLRSRRGDTVRFDS